MTADTAVRIGESLGQRVWTTGKVFVAFVAFRSAFAAAGGGVWMDERVRSPSWVVVWGVFFGCFCWNFGNLGREW